MKQFVVIFSLVLAAASGFPITGPGITQCVGNSGPLPLAASVAGCTAAPCSLPQQEDASINIIFRAPRGTSAMTTTAVAYLPLMGNLLPIHYDLAEKSVTCNYLLNSSCPVNDGDVLMYTLQFFVDPALPVGMVPTIEFSILDDNREAVSCLRVPVVIQPPRAQTAALTN